MKLSNIPVEQITLDGKVINDCGEILTNKEITKYVTEYFPNIKNINGCLYGNYNGVKYGIYIKNISYLGTPHPYFKKEYRLVKILKIFILIIGRMM